MNFGYAEYRKRRGETAGGERGGLAGGGAPRRYDPFDLTRIEVWYKNAFLELAKPEEIATTSHPDVELDPVPKPSPNSGLDYLALLRLERERLVQEQMDTIHFTQLDASNPKEDPSNDDSQ